MTRTNLAWNRIRNSRFPPLSPRALARSCSGLKQRVALQEAAERGCCDGISSALEAGAEVNGRGPGLWTALHLAARYGHAKAVERLVEAGANVEQRNKLHFAPLHHAAMRGHTDVAKKLVELGADVHAITLEGHTAMDWAERNGWHRSRPPTRRLTH
eukprot:57877-Rhodomonas_salina.1